jgi:flagellar assembly factor FliW
MLHPKQNLGELRKHTETIYHTVENLQSHLTPPSHYFRGDEDITDLEGNVIKINHDLPLHLRKQALTLLYRYRHLFTTDVEKIKIVKAKPYLIRLKSNEPVSCPEYQLGHREREKALEVIKKLQIAKVIEQSQASYRSPIFVKKKSDNSIRLLVDYQKLNNFVHLDRNTVIRPQILLDKLHKMRYFNLCDLISGYYQLPLHEESRDCTSFAIDGKLFRFRTLPQGLCCSSAAMAQAVNEIFQDEIYDNIMATYIDDFLSYAENFDAALQRLERI